MENIVTIPKELAKRGELVVMPRIQYEEYLRFKKIFSPVKISPAEKKAIKEGRKEIKEGKYFTLKQLKDELGD